MTTAKLSKCINTLSGFLMSDYFGTLTLCSVHPASPALLTKNGPLESITIFQQEFTQVILVTDPFKV